MRQLKIGTMMILSIMYLCVITSCDNDEMTSRLSDLSDAEIVNMIKINFLQEYGGIEQERLAVCNHPLTHTVDCDIDTIINVDFIDANLNYEIMLRGEWKIKCLKDEDIYNDKFIDYFDRGSNGNSSLGNLSQEFDLHTSFRMAGNTLEEMYTISGQSFRNLTYTNEKYENFDAVLFFTLDTHQLDFTSCLLADESEYSCRIKLTNTTETEDVLIIEGAIKLIDNAWTLIAEDGTITALE